MTKFRLKEGEGVPGRGMSLCPGLGVEIWRAWHPQEWKEV